MIGKLSGTIDSIYDDYFIIDVNSVGYLVFASSKTLSNLEKGAFFQVMIETHVREDHIHLYGFVNLEEKSAFSILQSVKGVGTRMALAILSQMSPEEIQHALNIEDKTVFQNVSGVGKKLAERIITELKDKLISSKSYSGASLQNNSFNKNKKDNPIIEDAAMALISLGVNKIDAHTRIASILTDNPDISINDLIRLALKN